VANTWRIDKSQPYGGTTRARLAAAWLAADIGEIIGVGLNASGLLVKGAGNTGCIGVVVLSQVRNAGHPVDILKYGEAVGGTGALAVAGTSFSITNAGVIAATAAGVSGNLGHTIEADRLYISHRTV
jgi:hypothetical protein